MLVAAQHFDWGYKPSKFSSMPSSLFCIFSGNVSLIDFHNSVLVIFFVFLAFLSQDPIRILHSGQTRFVLAIVLSKQDTQKLWLHGNVTGSIKMLLHIGHSTLCNDKFLYPLFLISLALLTTRLGAIFVYFSWMSNQKHFEVSRRPSAPTSRAMHTERQLWN